VSGEEVDRDRSLVLREMDSKPRGGLVRMQQVKRSTERRRREVSDYSPVSFEQMLKAHANALTMWYESYANDSNLSSGNAGEGTLQVEVRWHGEGPMCIDFPTAISRLRDDGYVEIIKVARRSHEDEPMKPQWNQPEVITCKEWNRMRVENVQRHHVVWGHKDMKEFKKHLFLPQVTEFDSRMGTPDDEDGMMKGRVKYTII